jgi:Na+/proline symporter
LALFPQTFAFATLDWVVLGVYAAILLGIGFYFYRPQGGTNEEFFVGNRRTHPLLAGISLFTALRKTARTLHAGAQQLYRGRSAATRCRL